MKIVINNRHSGFGISEEAELRYKSILGITSSDFFPAFDIPRNCQVLVALVEEMGERANNSYSRLKIVDIPDDVSWQIAEYEGMEWVAEKHRTWQ